MRYRLMILILAANTMCAGAAQVFDVSIGLTFRLHDAIEHPCLWWPRTLLEYPVEFGGSIGTDQLTMMDESGGPVPFQLSKVRTTGGGGLQSATVCFFSDLPSGATRTFILKKRVARNLHPEISETAVQGN